MEQDKFVINIGRQLGSGGKAVGEAVARRLGRRWGVVWACTSMTSS